MKHYTYFVDGVQHTYCADCLPDNAWLENMKQSGRLTGFRESYMSQCESCGHNEPPLTLKAHADKWIVV